MFIYDNYDNKYDNTISCSCLLFIKNLITMSLWNRISGSHFRSLVEVGSSHSALGRKKNREFLIKLKINDRGHTGYWAP
jgi:hypothetical protein